MKNNSKESSKRFWAYVASFGALWGTVEITMGSFLHTLRLPFAGILMACIGVTIMIAQRQLIPARGSTLATGVVAALCKSVSPGGIIFAPMVAIFIEAAIVEFVLLVGPRNFITACLAGALVVLCPLGHYIISKWIYYGGQIIELYIVALKKGGMALGLDTQASWWTLAAVMCVIVIIGAGSGILGWYLGRDAKRFLDRSAYVDPNTLFESRIQEHEHNKE